MLEPQRRSSTSLCGRRVHRKYLPGASNPCCFTRRPTQIDRADSSSSVSNQARLGHNSMYSNPLTDHQWGDTLALGDSKTGPPTVLLNAQARRVIDRQPRGQSEYVFPSPRNINRPRARELPLWYSIRRETRIEDVRLHDLRHTTASYAVMNGVSVPVVSRLLGHSDVRMTLRYTHLADNDIKDTAEWIGAAMAQLMALKHPHRTTLGHAGIHGATIGP